MSKEALAKVVQRAISDGAFRRQLSTNPTGALRGFDLDTAEIAAIRSGDSGRLSALGVDLRMSKAFTLTGANVDAGSMSVSSDLGASNTGALTPADGSTGSGALISGGGAGRDAALVSGDSSDTDPMIASGNEVGRAGVVIPGDPAHAFGAGSVIRDPDNPAFTGGSVSTGDAGAASVIRDPDNPAFTGGSVTDAGLTGSDGSTALPADADEYTPQFHSALDDTSGASAPSETGDGPDIQP